jgi:hypothetical protein
MPSDDVALRDDEEPLGDEALDLTLSPKAEPEDAEKEAPKPSPAASKR